MLIYNIFHDIFGGKVAVRKQLYLTSWNLKKNSRRLHKIYKLRATFSGV